MYKYFFTLVFSILAFSLLGQSTFQVFESIKDSMVEKKPNEPNIIDINSRLEIRLQKEHILKKASRAKGINEELLTKLDQLNFILEKQIETLEAMQRNIKNLSDEEKIKALGDYSKLMVDFYRKLKKSENAELRAAFSRYLKSYRGLRESNQIDIIANPHPQAYALNMLSSQADEVLEMMGNSEEFQKLSIQLVAFVNTRSDYQRKVHIENFDNYSEGEFFEVERWVTSFSEKDMAEFQRTKDNADKLNNLLKKDIKNIGDLARQSFNSIGCIEDLVESINELKNDTTLFGTGEEIQGKDLLEKAQSIFNKLSGLLSKINDDTKKQATGGNILEIVNNTQKSSFDEVFSLSDQFKKIREQLTNLKVSQNPKIAEFINQAIECSNNIEIDIKKVKNIIGIAKEVIGPFKKTAELADDISGAAFDFSLDELPSTGYINMQTTGKRKNGDEIEIKLKIRTEEEKEAQKPGITIEKRTFELQQVKVFSITKVTLILAIPPSGSSIALLEKNRVQFSPSGSLLFKFGSRKSRTWNFISMGAGFNISTPDFDLNGSPDVALGAIVTVLKDIVSFGYSYNTTTNTPFWFVGLSIPVTLPGIPINNVQSKNVE